MVVSCASPGDTITKMSKIVQNENFKKALSPAGYQWDVILLSGGGNDLIDAAMKFILKPGDRSASSSTEPKDYVNEALMNKILTDIAQGYKKLAALRDKTKSPAKGKPIVTHTYDHVTPRNEPARFIGFPLSGPWLYKTFKAKEVPLDDWIPLAKYLIDGLSETIIELQTGPTAIENFHVVDTRGTLTLPKVVDVGPTTHWLNEIHPNHDGYKELCRKIERDKLYEILYGVF